MIHVERVALLTDAPLSDRQARSLSTLVVSQLNAVFQAARTPAPQLRIGELQLTIPRGAVTDLRALAAAARSAARRILDRAQE